MKKRYQIDPQRAVQEFRQLAREENPNLQMIFPMAEVVGLLRRRRWPSHASAAGRWSTRCGTS